MKATGIVRKLDHLGRLVLPVELRHKLKISEGDAIEFFVDCDTVVIRKYDTVGDLVQILEDTEQSIRLQEYMAPEKVNKLLEMVEEMKQIAEENRT